MQIGFDGDLADDIRRVHERLRSAADAKRLRRELVAALRRAAKPAATAAKQAARNLPDNPTAPASTGLRRRMASSIGVQVRGGRNAAVKVRMSRARLGEQAGAARSTNRGRWRHPVFGDRDVWVQQESRPGWFDKAVRIGGVNTKREIRQVLNDLERRLGG